MRKSVVEYGWPFYFSFIVWAFGWLILYNVITDDAPFPKNSPGPWFDVVFWGLIIFVNGFFGPIFAIKYSTRISIFGDERIEVSKLFGTIKKLYDRQEIVSFELREIKRTNEVVISFADGNKVEMSSFARNYEMLCYYLQQ
jgi:hypothetical protein